MSSIVDASAWIEYFSGTAKGKRVKDEIERGEVLITGFIVAEVCAKFLREGRSTHAVLDAFAFLASFIDFNAHLGERTANIYVEIRRKKSKFSMADAHVLACAQEFGAKVVTCDNDFVGIKEAIVVR
jgi:predicted nucleic acid-binding protein